MLTSHFPRRLEMYIITSQGSLRGPRDGVTSWHIVFNFSIVNFVGGLES